jgi:hypothetical protein
MKRVPAKSRTALRAETASSAAVIAPIKGWSTSLPIAAGADGYALALDNFFPTATDVQLRKGIANHVTGLVDVVKSLCVWNGTTSSKLFAVTNIGIFDASSNGVAGAAVQARTQGYCQSVNFTGTGGSFLLLVNGTDDLVYTNGTTWTSIANFPITGGGTLTTSNIDNVNSFKRALYFIEKNSMNFYYLPVDQINGTVSKFPLGGLFSKGGKLVAMGTWTLDGGTGQEDYSVFISSEGQIAVYQGTDPSTAATWVLKGVYDFASPLGLRCMYKFAGDLLIISQYGVFSMNKALASSKFNIQATLSENISEAIATAVSFYGSYKGWQSIYHPGGDFILINIPVTEYGQSHQYVMNTLTNAWCRFTGWNSFCWVIYKDELYTGMAGKVAKAWVPGNDFSDSITATVRTTFKYFTPRARVKESVLLQPVLTTSGNIAVNVAMDSDFRIRENYGTAVFGVENPGIWSVDPWDGAAWGGVLTPSLDWVSVSCHPFYCAATRLRVIARDATVSWASINYLYQVGGLL